MPDYSIALQNMSPQIQSPNELMTNAYALRQAQQTNQLGQMKMDEYARGITEQNQFKNELANARTPEDVKNAYYRRGMAKDYNELLYKQAEISNLGAKTTNLGFEGEKTQIESAAKKQTMLQSMARDLSTRPSDANIMAYAEDIAASPLFTPEEKAAVKRRAQDLLSKPMDQRVPDLASQGASAADLKPNIQMQNLNNTSNVLSVPAYGGAPTTLSTTPMGISPEAQLKAETAQAKTTQTQQAKTSVATAGQATISELANKLSGLYDKLDEGGGIVSTKMREGSNIGRAISGSYVGRATGHALGGENQRIRESIENTRPLLLQAIKSATGMSAKQMDSNVELKMYLMAATDPTKSLESNKEALATLVQLYGIGGVGVANGSDVAESAAPAAPARKNVCADAKAKPKATWSVERE